MPMTPIYLDFNATTPLSDELLLKMPDLLKQWGNPSSIHLASRGPKSILRETRRKLAELFKVSPLEIIFNSGASEGNNTVLKSVWSYYRPGNVFNHPVKNEFIISMVEHPSVIKTAQFLQSEGAIIHWIPVSKDGILDLNFIQQHINSKTALISVMFANNETGSLFPLKQISEVARKNQILVHSDCVQAFGKEEINLKDLDLDYATFSAHKFYALKGCGILYVKKNAPYMNLVHGGGQERSRRGGTENILGIAALNVVLDQMADVKILKKQMQDLRDYFEQEITKIIPNVTITCEKSSRLANTSSLVIRDIDGETLLVSLDLKGFAVSTGAACSSGNPEPSPVLLAIGLSRDEAQSSLRVSLGWTTTQEQIDLFIKQLAETVQHLRQVDKKYEEFQIHV